MTNKPTGRLSCDAEAPADNGIATLDTEKFVQAMKAGATWDSLHIKGVRNRNLVLARTSQGCARITLAAAWTSSPAGSPDHHRTAAPSPGCVLTQ
ncbi:hypothetical protein Amsp01_094550 [Amycolatopsis sp. NBRC 101858]|uniref:hypothetical protein n=1 Tax=Amycolatopsis sp. NBRC 101858 TaxID=3032200 RepID=UPI0024A2D119|nr:hypothetical protein [Amycolatopsis sp. NBRC 101858]GLY43432.1 hypothetical protein Amsp01_094550 [Amycolatopsis sp. NBRC 101858]